MIPNPQKTPRCSECACRRLNSHSVYSVFGKKYTALLVAPVLALNLFTTIRRRPKERIWAGRRSINQGANAPIPKDLSKRNYNWEYLYCQSL
jgi:hypothetical protein